jgi:hypothetical protein
MQRHREPLAAVLAAIAIFVGIVAPSLTLILAVTLLAVGLAVLVLEAGAEDIGTAGRRSMQNPR